MPSLVVPEVAGGITGAKIGDQVGVATGEKDGAITGATVGDTGHPDYKGKNYERKVK